MGRTPLAVMALALLASGCGTSQDDPAEKAHATVETFVESCARGDALAALDILTEAAAADFLAARSGVEGCRLFLAPVVPDRDPEDPAELRAVEVVDARANAGYAAVEVEGDGETATVELEQVRGVWQVAGTS